MFSFTRVMEFTLCYSLDPFGRTTFYKPREVILGVMISHDNHDNKSSPRSNQRLSSMTLPAPGQLPVLYLGVSRMTCGNVAYAPVPPRQPTTPVFCPGGTGPSTEVSFPRFFGTCPLSNLRSHPRKPVPFNSMLSLLPPNGTHQPPVTFGCLCR